MKTVEEYIKKRKKSVDSSNEKEYLKVLDLETTGITELELFTKFLAEEAIKQTKG